MKSKKWENDDVRSVELKTQINSINVTGTHTKVEGTSTQVISNKNVFKKYIKYLLKYTRVYYITHIRHFNV